MSERTVSNGHGVEPAKIYTERSPLPGVRRVRMIDSKADDVVTFIPIIWHRRISQDAYICIGLLDETGRTGRFELPLAVFEMLPETDVEW